MLARLAPLLLAATVVQAEMNHVMPPLDTRAFASAAAGATLVPGSIVPNFRLTDHTGLTRELYYETGAKATVIVFTNVDSPRSLQTAAALRALRAKYTSTDVVIWQIDANLGTARSAIAAHQTLFNNDTPVLIDEAQMVTAELGATRQLEAFVIGPGPLWQLAYRGPLDNADPSGTSAPTINHVADAVAAVLSGKTPASAQVALSTAAPLIALASPSINYPTDVAPIVLRRCVQCHSAGNIAPFTLSRITDLQDRANSVRAGLLQKRMSPWHADAQFGVFTNDAAMTAAEAATLHAWVRAGAPRGTGADPLAAAPAPASGDWPLGQPDLIVTLPKQDLPATGTIDYRYISVPVPLTTDRWVKAAVVKPGNRRVVHHALVFEGGLVDLLLAGGGLGGFFAGYVPGLQQTFYPNGTGKLMHQGSQITFQMHYTASGQPETDQTEIGFYFHATPPPNEMLTKAASTISITIPAGAREYEREASFTPSTTRDVMLYEVNPHMHYRGKRMKFEALYPNGTTEVLLNVPQYDFNWQSQYRLAQPRRLPAGTVVRVSGAFDNSPLNPYNPDPKSVVRFGEQTGDEMFIGYINYSELPNRATAAAPAFASNLNALARVGTPFRLALAASNAPTSYTCDNLPAGLTLANGIISGTPATTGRHALVVTATNPSGSASALVDLAILPSPGAPVFNTQPRSIRTQVGATVTLAADVSAFPKPTYTWYFRGGEFCNTDGPSLTLTNLTAAYAGDYVCVASNSEGITRSATATVSLDFTGLVNLSARANVGTGANVVIPGITIRGDKPKQLLIRAAGPALAAFGVPGALANPIVSVFDSNGQKVLVNDNWGDVPNLAELRDAAVQQGAFALPEGSRDAAMLVTVPAGSYTIQVTGAGTGTAAQGISAVEVYEADSSAGTLVNLSCRARVGTGGDVLIAGFVIRGSQPRRLLVRAVGPTLADLGVTGTLADPKIEVTAQADGKTVGSNDNWDASLASTFTSVGAFALRTGSKDAALVLTLPPGAYTATVSGVGTSTGIAIVEVYDLP